MKCRKTVCYGRAQRWRCYILRYDDTHYHIAYGNGFYKFNGVDAVKILTEYDHLVDGVNNSSAEGVFCNGKFYFKLQLNIDDFLWDVVIVYNPYENTSYIVRFVSVNSLVFCSGSINNVYATNSFRKELFEFDNSGTFYGAPLGKNWISPKNDFGITERRKILTKISLYTKEEIILKVFCDDVEHVYNLNGGGIEQVYPCLKGEEFAIEIICLTESPEICNLTLQIEYVKGTK